MQIVIDIPEIVYRASQIIEVKQIPIPLEVIANGIPLDKIRTEIEELKLHKAQYLTNDNKVCIDSQAVLNIIDKYIAESEVTDANFN